MATQSAVSTSTPGALSSTPSHFPSSCMVSQFGHIAYQNPIFRSSRWPRMLQSDTSAAHSALPQLNPSTTCFPFPRLNIPSLSTAWHSPSVCPVSCPPLSSVPSPHLTWLPSFPPPAFSPCPYLPSFPCHSPFSASPQGSHGPTRESTTPSPPPRLWLGR